METFESMKPEATVLVLHPPLCLSGVYLTFGVCTCAQTGMGMCIFLHMKVRANHWASSLIVLHFIFETWSLPGPGVYFFWLMTFRSLPASSFPSAGVTDTNYQVNDYAATMALNSELHIYETGTLSTEPSPCRFSFVFPSLHAVWVTLGMQ